MNFRNPVWIKIILSVICTLFWNPVHAQLVNSVNREPSKNQILLSDGVSNRLIKKMQNNDAFITIGVYQDFLFSKTRILFETYTPGFYASFQHQLWKYWRGGIEARWSHWQQKNGDFRYAMPFGLYSKISVKPNFLVSIFTISPYLNAGIGYTILFQGNSYFNLNLPPGFGQISLIGGGGIEFILLKSFGFRVGFDAWKGLTSENYFAGALSLGLVKRL